MTATGRIASGRLQAMRRLSLLLCALAPTTAAETRREALTMTTATEPPSPPELLSESEQSDRLQVRGRTMYLDGAPWIMRGICYSPARFGDDPGYAEPWGDYFTSNFEPIFTRDIQLMLEMGANTIRLYTFKRSRRHVPFLDAAYAAGLVVSGAFEMGNAAQTPLKTNEHVREAQTALREQLRASRHPAFVMWLVGNELNGAWQMCSASRDETMYVCDQDYAEYHDSSLVYKEYGSCMFGQDARTLGMRVDELCSVVKEAGLLCSTPFAGVHLPESLMGKWDDYLCGGSPIPISCPATFGAVGWIQLWEPIVTQIDFWSVNAYPGKNFTDIPWLQLEAYTSRPFVVTEYGVDAFDTELPTAANRDRNKTDIDMDGPDGRGEFLVGAPNEDMQSEWLLSLVEDLERHSTTCIGPQCKERLASGGALMSWVDELWKGRVNEASANKHPVTLKLEEVKMCPDRSQFYHALCGYPSSAQPDDYVNEEWFGLFAVREQCGTRKLSMHNGDADRLRPRTAWFRLQLLWKHGGCLAHGGNLRSGPQALPYDETDYPLCATEVARRRAAYEGAEWSNHTARNGAGGMALFECDFQLLAHYNASGLLPSSIDMESWGGNATAVCPLPPAHMVSILASVDALRDKWDEAWPEGRPLKCNHGENALNAADVLLFSVLGLCALCILGVNWMLVKRAGLVAARSARQSVTHVLCACTYWASLGLSRPRITVRRRSGERSSLWSAGSWSTEESDTGRSKRKALSSRAGHLATILTRHGPPPTLDPAIEALKASIGPVAAHLGALFGFQMDTAEVADTGLSPPPSPPSSSSASLSPPSSSPLCSSPPSSSSAPSSSGAAQLLGGGLSTSVPSSVSNQLDHLISLLTIELQRMPPSTSSGDAFALAVRRVHATLLANFFRWLDHVRLSHHWPTLPEVVPELDMARTSRRLHEVLLLLLIYGEAANLRHMPECLAFLLFVMANALEMPPLDFHLSKASEGGGDPSGGEQSVVMSVTVASADVDQPSTAEPASARAVLIKQIWKHNRKWVKRRKSIITSVGVEAVTVPLCAARSAAGLNSQSNPRLFLESIVTPIYRFLKAEISDRREQPVAARVLYDDVNESFWWREIILHLLPTDLGSEDARAGAYAHLTDLLSGEAPFIASRRSSRADVGLHFIGAHKVLSATLRKTHRETASWFHLLSTFYRMWRFKLVMIHLLTVYHFVDFRLTPTLTWVLTDSACGLIGSTVDFIVCKQSSGLPPLVADLVRIAMIVLYVFQRILGGTPDEGAWWFHSTDEIPGLRHVRGYVEEVSPGWLPSQLGIFELAALVYTLMSWLHLLNLGGALIDTEALAHRLGCCGELVLGRRPYLGRAADMRRSTSLEAFASYFFFWAVVLVAKVAFDSLLIESVVGPTKALWEDPSSGGSGLLCWNYDLGSLPDEDKMIACLRDGFQGVPLKYDHEAGAWVADYTADQKAALQSLRLVRAYFFRIALVGMRWTIPVLMIFADTALFYTLFAALFSALLGAFRGQVTAVTWGDVVLCFSETVDCFASKLIALPASKWQQIDAMPNKTRGDGHRRLRAAQLATRKLKTRREELKLAAHTLAFNGEAFAYESTAREWQHFARAWNALVLDLHGRDIISSAERDTLAFDSLVGPSVDSFFGLPEYTVLPSAISSPVFAPQLWDALSVSVYSMQSHVLLQTRDLLCFLLTSLGMCQYEKRHVLLSALTQLAACEVAQHRRPTARTQDQRRTALPMLRLRAIALCTALVELHDLAVVVEEDEREIDDEDLVDAAASHVATSVRGVLAAVAALLGLEIDTDEIDVATGWVRDSIARAGREPDAELPSSLPRGVFGVVLDGCQAGVGLGVDDNNIVTVLKPQGRAAAAAAG